MTRATKNRLPLTELWARLDSPSVESYLAAGGYSAAIDAARQGGRDVIRVLRDADARTRDGAGDPLYVHWRGCQSAPAERKYVVCLADDPDRDAPIFTEIIKTCPHLVIEGLICGALAVGALEAYVYLRQGDYRLVSLLETAVSEAHREGFLGQDALLDIHIVAGDRAFLCGGGEPQLLYLEEALANRAPVDRGVHGGLFGWPTLAHDPETWAQVPFILDHGAEWYRGLGRNGLAGTKLLKIGGPVVNPGLYEVPLGISLLEAINDRAGGFDENAFIKALQLSGPSGGFLPPAMFELTLDYEILAEAGISMGSGSLEVIDDTVCMVARTLELLAHCLDDSCCQVAECDKRLGRIKRLLVDIEEGQGSASHLGSLQKLGVAQLGGSNLGTERSVARPLLTSLAYFMGDYTHHLDQGVCATGKRYGLTTAPCQAACPAGIDVPSYIALIGQGRLDDAIALIRQDNPLPWTCGLVCTHPCESVCTRGEMDDPISIMALKGYAAEKVMDNGGYPQPKQADPRPEKVAIIGSGPAGLSCAYFLALKGYRPTIYEAMTVPGGVLISGIPEYRLPSRVVQAEIQAILDMGVEIKTGVRVGRELTFECLREEGFKAFFLGLGAHQGMKLGIEGEDELFHVYDALSFLSQVRMGLKKAPADQVVVVGGGNAAIDAARTCIRLGCSQVTIAYRRTRVEMPAWEEEIRQAEEEGVEILYLTIPKRIVGEAGVAVGLECLKAELGEADATGRRRPVPVTGSEQIIPAGAVIAAIGQAPDVTCIRSWEDLTVNDRGRLVVNSETLQTNIEDIFAGGDVVTGPATVVQAVGAGKWAAESIDAYIEGRALPQGFPEKKPRDKLDTVEMDAAERCGLKRTRIPLISMEERRTTFKWVESGMSDEEARCEAARCLRCDLCVGCGLCQMVCNEMGLRSLQLNTTSEGRLALTDYHNPARSCIGCGSCVQACPHKNIRMLDTGDERRIVFCGTETAKLKLATCDECGQLLAPEAYLSYLNRLVSGEPTDIATKKLCPTCSRKRLAEGQVGDALWFPPSH